LEISQKSNDVSISYCSALSPPRILPSLVYIHDWRRVKLCLGCSHFEEKHSSENLAKLVDTTTDIWNIRHKVRQ
jgi:hypothetical protein